MKIKNLDSADALPFRQSMHKSSDYDSWDDDYSGVYYDHCHMFRFLEKHVGQKFDEVYADFLRHLRRQHYSNTVYEHKKCVFKEYLFRNDQFQHYRVENGMIVRCDENKRRYDRNVYIYPDSNEKWYRFKTDKLNDEQLRHLHMRLGSNIFCYLVDEFFDEVFYNKHHSVIQETIDRYAETHTNHYTHRRTYTWKTVYSDKDYFDTYYTEEPKILKPGTSESKKYRAEMSDGERKRVRDRRKEIEAFIDDVYRRDFERRKRIDAENDEKIIRHGFDLKTSFRNV